MTRTPAARCGDDAPLTDAQVIDRLAVAIREADAAAIRAVLHAAVVTVVDHGGSTDGAEMSGASDDPIVGADQTADALERSGAGGDVQTTSINAAPGLVIRHRGRITAVVCARVRGNRIVELWIIRNPEKLQRWDRA